MTRLYEISYDLLYKNWRSDKHPVYHARTTTVEAENAKKAKEIFKYNYRGDRHPFHIEAKKIERND